MTLSRAGLRAVLPRAALAGSVLLTLLLAPQVASPAAGAAPGGESRGGHVAVIEVSGLLDRVLVDFVESQISKAEDEGALALVLQLNSGGAVVADARLDDLVERIETADVPVDVWVGPSGSKATGGATDVLAAARTVGMAGGGGSRIEVTTELLGDGSLDGKAAVGDKVSAGDARDLGLIDNVAPTIGLFVYGGAVGDSEPGEPTEVIDGLPGVETQVVDGQPQPLTQTRFSQLPLDGQLMHTVSSPPVAYLLFAIGLALILFELFTAGVGVAGLVGAGCLVLGSYGLAALPTNPVGIGLLLFAMVGYGIDVQTGVPRVWSGIATVSFTVGSVILYDGLSLSWITLLVAIVGMGVAMIGGMPAMVRSRFSTPTIGREWMVGEVGTAVGAVAPEGIVRVRDAPWRARTNRATPIEAAQEVRVVSIEGLLLEVEPLEGAAKDHRDRR
jgi:membrane-bound serine protease (ClpP class)